MKKNEISQALLVHYKRNFSQMIIGAYNMVISCRFQREYNKNISYPIIIKGNLKEKGSKFIIKRSDLNLYIFYEITELIITDYYASFKYHIYKTIPETYEYDYILEIRYINEDQCDFFFCFIFDQKMYLSEKEIHDEIKRRKNMYKIIERSFRKLEILKIAIVYSTINCKIELIFDVLKNMKMIHKYCHLLANEVDYKGEVLKANYLINLTDYLGKLKYQYIAKVKTFNIKNDNTTKECILELIFQKGQNSLSYLSKTKIIIIIYEYSEFSSIYLFYFFCNSLNNKENFNNFIKIKNRELTKFKNIIENYNQKHYRKKVKQIDKE